jgi:hypothetical protein
MYDKYRNWPLPSNEPFPTYTPTFDGKAPTTIEEQVLIDLMEEKDQTSRLEVLDSYLAYAQRCYRAEIVKAAAQAFGGQITKIIEPFLGTSFPSIWIRRRARMADSGQEFKP